MIYATAIVPVNPEGETRLTRAQAWKGLERKARDARLFLAPGLCTCCVVVEENATHFVREATIGGIDLREIVTLDPGSKVTFFQADGPREGAIINELFDDEDGVLQLRFIATWAYVAKRQMLLRSRPSRLNSPAKTATGPPC